MNRISPNTPIADLLAHAGISQSELARRLGVAQSAIPKALRRGSGVGLGWLVEAAAACGFRLDIRVVRGKRGRE